MAIPNMPKKFEIQNLNIDILELCLKVTVRLNLVHARRCVCSVREWHNTRHFATFQIKSKELIVKPDWLCRLFLSASSSSLQWQKPGQKNPEARQLRIKGGYYEVSVNHCTIPDNGLQSNLI